MPNYSVIVAPITCPVSDILDHMKKMKNNAIVGNIGPFSIETDKGCLEGFPGIDVEHMKSHLDRFVFLDGRGVIVLSCGRLLNFG